MNKIILEHYPADKLPEDVRKHFSRGGSVTLEVAEEAEDRPRPMTGKEVAAMLRAARERNKDNLRTQEEIVKEIRELRDEWDA